MTWNTPHIVSATGEAKDYTVRLGWDNGAETSADFSKVVGHGVFAPMKQPEFFRQVSVEPHGRSITWPGELSFDAAALWFAAKPQDKPDVLKQYEVSNSIPNKLIVPSTSNPGMGSGLKDLLRSTARLFGFQSTNS
jgi:hypothetical protein